MIDISTGAEIQSQLNKELDFCPGRWQNLLDKEWVGLNDILKEIRTIEGGATSNIKYTLASLRRLINKLEEYKNDD